MRNTDRKPSLSGAISAVETFFDRLKLSCKWRLDRWEGLRVIPYRSHGTREEVTLHGRVLDDQAGADLDFLVLGESVELAVVSNVDDAVIRTGATSRFQRPRTGSPPSSSGTSRRRSATGRCGSWGRPPRAPGFPGFWWRPRRRPPTWSW